jgi:hypothetical protein
MMHDLKKPVPDLIRDGYRFSDKIVRNAKTARRSRGTLTH